MTPVSSHILDSNSNTPATVTCLTGSGGADKGREQAYTEKDRCERISTATDCYQFACETGVITPDELFLRMPLAAASTEPATGDKRSGTASTGDGSTTSKKRRVGDENIKEEEPEGAAGSTTNTTSTASTTTTTRPRVLRSLAAVTEKYGNYVRNFPFQMFFGGSDEMDAGDKGRGHGGTNNPRPVSRGNSAFDHTGTLLDDPGALPSERAAARLARAVLIRRGFNLMAACLSGSDRRDDMAAVLVREGLWGEDAHRLVMYSLAWPWAGGLLPRASDGDEVEICKSVVGPGSGGVTR